MKLLTELINVRRLDDEEPREDEFQDDDLEDEREDETGPQEPAETEPEDELADFDDIEGDEQPPEDDQEMDQDGGEDEFADFDDIEGDTEDQAAPVDPDRAGVLRNVKGARLVYKREQADGTYEEMWIYNSGAFKRDLETKKTIVAGTDIPPNASQSPDGSQTLKMWSAGNADIIVISGLPQ